MLGACQHHKIQTRHLCASTLPSRQWMFMFTGNRLPLLLLFLLVCLFFVFWGFLFAFLPETKTEVCNVFSHWLRTRSVIVYEGARVSGRSDARGGVGHSSPSRWLLVMIFLLNVFKVGIISATKLCPCPPIYSIGICPGESVQGLLIN